MSGKITIETEDAQVTVTIAALIDAIEGDEAVMERIMGAIDTQVFAEEACKRIRSCADNDIIDTLAVFDDSLIEDEARDRGLGGDTLASELGSWDLEKLQHAIANDDGRRVIDILRPIARRLG